ncbi:hypothetical protein SLS60_011041 [Paraconiothyrium brasiliense]|uniref:Uncharacterized protein n=1 Tax=Paraconiothyrium brasiliense TaxID=300254 RepID=A0ABR3QKF4_9PLEO
METISNVVNSVSQTATKAIWGEQQNNETAGNEPVSGVQGKGTATEPYDKGNSEDPTDPATRNETAGEEPVSGLQGKGTATDPFDQGNSADATNTATLPIREKSSSTDTSGVDSSLAVRPDENNTAGLAGTANLSDTLSKTGTNLKTDTVSGGKNEPGLAGFSNDPVIDPKDTSQLPAVVSNATTDNTLTSTPADSQSAGMTGTQNLSDTLAKTNPPVSSPITSPKITSTTGQEGGDLLGSAKGTGEQHVKSTGTAADGGDFDATKPGAGKEADRTSEQKRSRGDSIRAVLERADMVTGLMESKGESAATADKTETSPSGEKEKVSKMEKLKEKLHIKKH